MKNLFMSLLCISLGTSVYAQDTVKETITTETRVIERPVIRYESPPVYTRTYYGPPVYTQYGPPVYTYRYPQPIYTSPVPQRTVVRQHQWVPGPLGVFYYRTGNYVDTIYDR